MEFELELARLAEPIAPDQPCGDSLEDTPALAAFDAYRVFGLLTAPQNEPGWRDLRASALATLQKSKDFRVLAHFAAACMRTGSLADALRIFPLLDTWLRLWWDEVYPRIDQDAIMRRNALGDFADRVAIIDGLRRLPLMIHPQLGSLSLRDIDIATGQQPNPDPENEPRTQAEIHAALSDADPQTVRQLSQLVAKAREALTSVQDIMRNRADAGSVPQFDPLFTQLTRIQQVIAPRMAGLSEAPARSAAEGATSSGEAMSQSALNQGALKLGALNSRQDAIRALDAVAAYFRRHEPSSPVPLMVERAKRMVSMSFLEVVADLAPDALEQARKAAGIRDSD